MEQNPHVKVDFQWFAFADLGKKISVGFATGTAPDGFVSQDWFMPTWLDKGLLAPLDVKQLGYGSYDAFTADFAKAFVDGATKDGKVYGYPMWFYGYCNYLNAKQFKEVGLDPDKDWPQSWEQLGEVAKRLTVKDGDKFVRQGFKFAMHSAQWTMIQYNPILIGTGGKWFDEFGKCTINNDAGVKAMTIRASIAQKYGAEDPADSIATNPIPGMDFLKERASMFFCHPLPIELVKAENPAMAGRTISARCNIRAFRPGKGFSTTYGFNLVINAKAAAEKQEDASRSLQVHDERSGRCLEGCSALHLRQEDRMGRQSRGAEIPLRQRDHPRQGRRRLPAALAGVQRTRRLHAPRRCRRSC